MSRDYCRADKPFPVSTKCMSTLRRMAEAAGTMNTIHAPVQIERLRLGGYVHVNDHGLARITDAGRAILSGERLGGKERQDALDWSGETIEAAGDGKTRRERDARQHEVPGRFPRRPKS